MDVICYCDGSGNGFVCAIFDYGEDYQRTYFGSINDRIFHEYRAILFAVELMEPGHKYILYNDSQGAVQHASGKKTPPTTIIKHLVQQIHKKVEHLDVTFEWMKRDQNLAGVMLDTKARDIYTDRGSSNNTGQ